MSGIVAADDRMIEDLGIPLLTFGSLLLAIGSFKLAVENLTTPALPEIRKIFGLR